MRKALVVGVSLLVPAVIVLGGWFVARPLYNRHREAVALEQARKFISRGDIRNACLCAQRALQLNATNVEACRILAGAAELARAPQQLAWRQRIAELSPTADDKLLLAAAALQVEPEPFALAADTLRGLAESAKDRAGYHVLEAQLALKLGELRKAEAEFAEASRLEPTNEVHRMDVAVLRLSSTNAALAAEARVTLDGLRANTNLQAGVLRWLVNDGIRRKAWATAERYSHELLASPGAQFADRLQHLRVLRESHAPGFEPFLQKMQLEVSTNAFATYTLAGWSNANELGARALEWLTNLPPNVRAQQPVPQAIAECLMTAKQWSPLEDFLTDQKWGEQDFHRLALLSRAMAEQKRPLAADAQWRLAVLSAGNRFAALFVLAQLAGQWGRVETEEKLLLQIAQKFPRDNLANRELTRIYHETGNTAGLNKLSAAMVVAHPNDPIAKNNLAATLMLRNQNLSNAHELARQAYDKLPDNPVIVSTYAWSLHLQGRTGDGLAALEKLNRQALNEPAVALYYGLLLRAVGQNASAGRYLSMPQPARLLPEERALLTQALNGL